MDELQKKRGWPKDGLSEETILGGNGPHIRRIDIPSIPPLEPFERKPSLVVVKMNPLLMRQKAVRRSA